MYEPTGGAALGCLHSCLASTPTQLRRAGRRGDGFTGLAHKEQVAPLCGRGVREEARAIWGYGRRLGGLLARLEPPHLPCGRGEKTQTLSALCKTMKPGAFRLPVAYGDTSPGGTACVFERIHVRTTPTLQYPRR
jgi:hypothetical protein